MEEYQTRVQKYVDAGLSLQEALSIVSKEIEAQSNSASSPVEQTKTSIPEKKPRKKSSTPTKKITKKTEVVSTQDQNISIDYQNGKPIPKWVQEVRTPQQSWGLDGYEQPKGLPVLNEFPTKTRLAHLNLDHPVALDFEYMNVFALPQNQPWTLRNPLPTIAPH